LTCRYVDAAQEGLVDRDRGQVITGDWPDVSGNIIVLCPNHHALCDMGAIPLNRSDILTVDGHVISDKSLEYHNDRIFGSIGRER